MLPHDLSGYDFRRIFLKGFQVQASIGFHSHETLARQRIVIDVDLYIARAQAPIARDQIDEVLDYDFLRDEIKAITMNRHFNLQETLAETIADRVLERPLVQLVRVQIQKPDVYEDCESLGVEVLRRQKKTL
ncbi:MAG: dihydroneopterin aldolase [Burkholderiaceae bacterium]|jgi:dihydroneopterin aldolase